MNKLCFLVLYCCISMGAIYAMSGPEYLVLDIARQHALPRVLSGVDHAIGQSASLVARGVTQCCKFCRDYPRLALFIIFVIPLLSSRWRSFLFDSLGGGIASGVRQVWAFIDARLFGWMHRGMEQVQSSLGAQHEELVSQGHKIGLLKTEVAAVGDELQDQIRKLECLLVGQAQQLGELKNQDHEMSLQVDATHSMATQHSSCLAGIQAQNSVLAERVDGVQKSLEGIGLTLNGLDEKIDHGNKDLQSKIDSLDALRMAFGSLEQQVCGQHKDLIASMENRLALLPESQRHILNEYSLQIGSRFDALSSDIDKVLRIAMMQHQAAQRGQDLESLRTRKVTVKS